MQESRRYASRDPARTRAIGAELAREARPGDVLGLVGELGAGKTVFVRGFVEGLGGDPAQVRSPTFTLMNLYDADMPIHHFDLYRLGAAGELDGIGFVEFARGDGVSLVEWADRIPEMAGEVTRWVRIDFGTGDDDRAISVEDVG
jgi:tRNA threonylcarbamoyladenosine biosynthesis protein TsaE